MADTSEDRKNEKLIYHASQHSTFLRRAKARFQSHKEANKVLSARQDPITKFIKRHTPVKEELEGGGEYKKDMYTPEHVKTDPRAKTKAFLEELEKRLDKEGTTVTHGMIDILEEEINNWTNGEAYIYKILTDALEESKPGAIVETEGAGRTQLEKIEKLYDKAAPRTSDTMIQIWANLAMGPKESVLSFKSRFDRLLKDMGKAQPEALVRSKNEQRLNFLNSLQRGGRFLDEIKDFKKNRTSITAMVEWCTSLEARGSI